MRVIEPKVISSKINGIDIKFSNGMREFIASLNKDNMTFENIVNNEVNVKVYSMIRNCCGASPLYVLESFKSEEDDLEIAELLTELVELIGNDMKKIL